jgi:glycosyltransferase involved in cell wall biosynthesis
MVTRAGFPLNEGVSGAARRDVVDGITYHRIRPDLEPGLGAERVANETARGLVPLIGSLRPALLQPTTNYVNAQVALALGERFDLPVVYEVRGFLEETWLSRMGDQAGEGDRYHAARAVETASMRRAAGIVTLSETMRADIIGRGGIEPGMVTVIPNAVDIERFQPGPRDPDLAAALGIDADEVVVGYISTFTAYEGIRYLIEAVGLLRGRGRRLRLLLVGDGEQRADLEIAAAEAGLTDGTVIFTGRVPHEDIERYYRTIDVFVVPRTNDRVSQLVTPLKPYEAMAMEKAIVVSGVGALLEIVVDGETGRSFIPEDPVSLADVIEPLLDDPAERARLGAAARAWVAANRTWERNGRRYRELYERLGVA